MLGVTPDAKDILEEALPGGFFYIPERDYFDYIYLREDLALLKGKKFQSSVTISIISRKDMNTNTPPITPELIPQCLKLECKWYKANETEDDAEDLNFERISMTYALNHYDELGLLGGALLVDGKVIAFTFGAQINHDTFGVHVEKRRM